MLPCKPNVKILPYKIGCLNQFPFLDETLDSITYYEMLQKLGMKTNEIIAFINTTLEQSINNYIDSKFNDMIINTMYEEETETLVLYLDKKESEV